MKKSTAFVIKIMAVFLGIILIIGSALYLFVFDTSDIFYIPQNMMVSSFVESKLEEIHFSEKEEEVEYKKDSFKGIISYGCYKSSPDEINRHFSNLNDRKYYGASMMLTPPFYQLYIREAQHMPLLKSWGYGWWNYDGNLYAKSYGKDEAKGKPNYRNHYWFSMAGDGYILSYDVFCNTRNVEEAFSYALECINERMCNT